MSPTYDYLIKIYYIFLLLISIHKYCIWLSIIISKKLGTLIDIKMLRLFLLSWTRIFLGSISDEFVIHVVFHIGHYITKISFITLVIIFLRIVSNLIRIILLNYLLLLVSQVSVSPFRVPFLLSENRSVRRMCHGNFIYIEWKVGFLHVHLTKIKGTSTVRFSHSIILRLEIFTIIHFNPIYTVQSVSGNSVRRSYRLTMAFHALLMSWDLSII